MDEGTEECFSECEETFEGEEKGIGMKQPPVKRVDQESGNQKRRRGCRRKWREGHW